MFFFRKPLNLNKWPAINEAEETFQDGIKELEKYNNDGVRTLREIRKLGANLKNNQHCSMIEKLMDSYAEQAQEKCNEIIGRINEYKTNLIALIDRTISINDSNLTETERLKLSQEMRKYQSIVIKSLDYGESVNRIMHPEKLMAEILKFIAECLKTIRGQLEMCSCDQ